MNLTSLLAAVASIALLGGCCTAQRVGSWEYKVAYPSGHRGDANTPDPNQDPKLQEALMNELGKDGWIFVEKDASSGAFYFKRERR